MEGTIEVKIIVAVEMAANEIVDLFLALRAEVLEFVHSPEVGHIQTIGKNTTRCDLCFLASTGACSRTR